MSNDEEHSPSVPNVKRHSFLPPSRRRKIEVIEIDDDDLAPSVRARPSAVGPPLVKSVAAPSPQPLPPPLPPTNVNSGVVATPATLITLDTAPDLFTEGELTVLRADFEALSAHMRRKQHLVLVDLDNWAGFFQRLPELFPPSVFVLCFCGMGLKWSPPWTVPAFRSLVVSQSMALVQCGASENAADFAMCFHVGRLHVILPNTMPFVILTGDMGFSELERQLNLVDRRVVLINPHHEDPVVTWLSLKSVWDQ
jgi:hypothetical protein